MAEMKTKEKFEGFWAPEGVHTKFNREWSGVRFSDQQCADLLEGKEIEIEATSKAGKSYTAKGSLAEQTFNTPEGNDVEFIGFKPDFGPKQDALGQDVPPDAWCNHDFTPDELAKLKGGDGVYAEDFHSKRTGNDFACTVWFKEEEGRKKIVPEFGG